MTMDLFSAAILLVLQLMAGNTGTAMIPGTPTAAPQQTGR